MIGQKICYVLYFTFARHLPKSNAKIGGGIFKRVRYVLAKGFIEFCGKNVNLQKGAVFSRKLSIGDNSSIGINSVVQGTVSIGKNVMMGPEVFIYTQNHNHDRTDIPMILQHYEEEKPVVIDDDVWIGSRVTILPGVHIHQGVVLGASTVVTKDIPEYSVAVGNPCRVVRNRKEINNY